MRGRRACVCPLRECGCAGVRCEGVAGCAGESARTGAWVTAGSCALSLTVPSRPLSPSAPAGLQAVPLPRSRSPTSSGVLPRWQLPAQAPGQHPRPPRTRGAAESFLPSRTNPSHAAPADTARAPPPLATRCPSPCGLTASPALLSHWHGCRDVLDTLSAAVRERGSQTRAPGTGTRLAAKMLQAQTPGPRRPRRAGFGAPERPGTRTRPSAFSPLHPRPARPPTPAQDTGGRCAHAGSTSGGARG